METLDFLLLSCLTSAEFCAGFVEPGTRDFPSGVAEDDLRLANGSQRRASSVERRQFTDLKSVCKALKTENSFGVERSSIANPSQTRGWQTVSTKNYFLAFLFFLFFFSGYIVRSTIC